MLKTFLGFALIVVIAQVVTYFFAGVIAQLVLGANQFYPPSPTAISYLRDPHDPAALAGSTLPRHYAACCSPHSSCSRSGHELLRWVRGIGDLTIAGHYLHHGLCRCGFGWHDRALCVLQGCRLSCQVRADHAGRSADTDRAHGIYHRIVGQALQCDASPRANAGRAKRLRASLFLHSYHYEGACQPAFPAAQEELDYLNGKLMLPELKALIERLHLIPLPGPHPFCQHLSFSAGTGRRQTHGDRHRRILLGRAARASLASTASPWTKSGTSMPAILSA